jgi:hypothetical protein
MPAGLHDRIKHNYAEPETRGPPIIAMACRGLETQPVTQPSMRNELDLTELAVILALNTGYAELVCSAPGYWQRPDRPRCRAVCVAGTARVALPHGDVSSVPRILCQSASISNMSTEVIYARVPAALKEAADAYASEHGKTLTGAVAELLDRGLGAVSDERSIGQLEASLARVKAEKAEAEAELQAATTQLAALKALAQRASRKVGDCPNCHGPITGYDLLATGQCRSCNQTLSGLIVPERTAPTLDQRELLVLVGALGAVLAIAYIASK